MNTESNMDNQIFSYINDDHSRTMLTNAYNAVVRLGLIDFFKSTNPPDDKGYMFWSDNRVTMLGKELESDGHSGSSFAWVCRNLQMYFRDADAHKNAFLKNQK
jgi:hypothetical protein